MKLLGILSFAFALLSGDGEALSTQRRVHGVITSVDAGALTISSSKKAVTGRIDAARTRVTVHGRPARMADLELAAHAKAELCLDDVWLAIDVH
jgi:hypothetical protein